jgi:hypothetical protein
MPTTYSPNDSPFTTELPVEAKMLMGGMDMNAAFTHTMYGQDWVDPGQYYDGSEIPGGVKMKEHEREPYPDPFDNNLSTMKWDAVPQVANLADDTWESFIDDTAWRNDK